MRPIAAASSDVLHARGVVACRLWSHIDNRKECGGHDEADHRVDTEADWQVSVVRWVRDAVVISVLV